MLHPGIRAQAARGHAVSLDGDAMRTGSASGGLTGSERWMWGAHDALVPPEKRVTNGRYHIGI
jgi:hypothetical protein